MLIDKDKLIDIPLIFKNNTYTFVNDEIKYIGRCKDSMKQRVNSGYGKISPKNCFNDGQSTNCKVNFCR